MTDFLQILISGLMGGGVYALIAIGFVIIFKSSGVFNLALGEMALIGGYLAFTTLVVFKLPLWLGLIVTIIIAGIIGMLIERLCMRRLVGESLLAQILVTLGVGIFLTGLVMTIWVGETKSVGVAFAGTGFQLGDIRLSQQTTVAFLVVLGMVGLLSYFFYRTNLGLGMRAAAEDQQLAQSAGIGVKTVFSTAWIICGVAAMIGGVLLGSIQGVSAYTAQMGLKALPAVLLGGLESFPGAIIGGLVIGLVESLSVAYLIPLLPGGGWGLTAAMPYIVIMIVLIVKPYGIFGYERIERI